MLSWFKRATLPAEIALDEFPNYSEFLQTGSRKVWASWKACDLVGQAVTTSAFALRREGSTGSIVVPGLSQLLRFPNRFQTFQELEYMTVGHIKLTGNAYWYKSQATINGDRPKELFPLNPKRVRIAADENRTIIGYVYRRNAADDVIPFEPAEIIHFKRPHFDNDFYGQGEIEAGQELLREFKNRDEQQRNAWEEGATASWLLSCTETLDPIEFEKAKAKWRKEFAGADNAGKTAWVSGNWKAQRLGLTPVQMQALERSRLTVEQIACLHGVPPSILGIRKAASKRTGEINERLFRSHAVAPMLAILQNRINRDLVSAYDRAIRFEFITANLDATAEAIQSWAPLFDRGIISESEFRQNSALPIGTHSGDEHRIRPDLVPLNSWSDILAVAKEQHE